MSLGKFVWYDLMCADPAAAQPFYEKLFGWTAKGGDHGYTHWMAGATPIGGMMAMEKREGVPNHWIGYVSVSDVDAVCEQAKSLGGQVLVAAHDIPKVGRFAVIQDQQGATISPIALSSAAPDGPERPPVGEFSWRELMTHDPAAAASFYGSLFGWTATTVDMGPMGIYTLLKADGKEVCGVMKLPDPKLHAHWIYYVHVESADASTEKAKALEGRLYVPPTSIPNVGRFSVVADPSGATIALFQV